MLGGVACRCLDLNNSNIVSLLGAMLWDVKMQALPVHMQLLTPASSQDLNAIC